MRARLVSVAALGWRLQLATARAGEVQSPYSYRAEMTAMIRGTSEDYTVVLTIDPDATTVTVGSYGSVADIG
jgi:hypothetical protein